MNELVAVLIGFALALVPVLLFVSGGVNAQYRDCWGREAVEQRRWWWASIGRMLIALVLLLLEFTILLALL